VEFGRWDDEVKRALPKEPKKENKNEKRILK
jgi:hypothetical protein